MSAATGEAVDTRAQDAAWWAMELPCESRQPCPPKPAAFVHIHACAHRTLLCVDHTLRSTRLLALGSRAICRICGGDTDVHQMRVVPL